MATLDARPRPPTRISFSPVRLRSLVVAALALSPAVLSAQARPSPFETIDVGLTILADVNRGALHRYWSPGPGFGAGATLPFYLGSVEAGVQYAHPQALRDDVPRVPLALHLRRLGRGTRAGERVPRRRRAPGRTSRDAVRR
ncbi:MAG: hypothetical protein ACREM9_10855 [Gemmatimonadales bacterium]